MKTTACKRGLAALLPLVLLLLLWVPAAAAEQRVFDGADLFSSEQEADLEERAAALRQESGMDVVLVTTDDAQGKTAMAYADDYYDYNGFGTGEDSSGVLFLIDMDNREAYISTCGEMIRYLTDARIESILDDAYVGLSQGDYYAAAVAFLDGTEACTRRGIPENQYNYDTETGQIDRHYSLSVRQVLLYVVLALAAGGLCCGVVVAKYQMKGGGYSYPFRQKGRLSISRRTDTFLFQNVAKSRISSESGGGGGGSPGRSSTHTSSSGRSHGGGGRSF